MEAEMEIRSGTDTENVSRMICNTRNKEKDKSPWRRINEKSTETDGIRSHNGVRR